MTVRSRALCTGLLAVSLALGAPAPGVSVADVPTDCPPVMPTAQIRPGMRGTGRTVVAGRTPRTFDAEVLGVLPDAVSAGRDMIVVELSGSAVDRHGVWAGMSGSPVSVGGRLIGAVAYGLAWGPSTTVGLTPAEDVVRLLDLPEASAAPAPPDSVAVTPELRMAIAQRHDMAVQAVGGTLAPLPAPLGVSGLAPADMARLREALTRSGLPMLAYNAGSATASTAPAATAIAGGSMAAVLSYGDVTMTAVGTTTYVCGDRAVAMGHPVTYRGAVGFGASEADVLTVIHDPLGGSYKLTTVGAPLGLVDQDRSGGLRLLGGRAPRLIPLRATVIDRDTGRRGTAITDLTESSWTPTVGFLNAIGAIDNAMDRTGGGSASVSWTVRGTRADGSPWSLTRDNRFATPGEIGYDATSELQMALSALEANALEAVTFTGVSLRGGVEQQVRRLTVDSATASVDGGPPAPLDPNLPLDVPSGAALTLTVTLRAYRAANPITVELPVALPAGVEGAGMLTVGAPGIVQDPWLCVWDPQACADLLGVRTFDGLLDTLANRPRNDDLVAEVNLFGAGGMPQPDGAIPGAQAPTARTLRRLDHVVSGTIGVPLNITPAR